MCVCVCVCARARREHELKSLNNSNPTNNPNNPGGEPQIGGGSGTPVAYDSPSPKPDQPQDSTQPLSNAPSLTDGGARDAHDSYDQHGGMGHAQSVTEDELGYGGGSGDGEGYKRGREESVEGEGEDGHGVLGSKRLHLEDESGGAVPECKLCARLVEQGRQKVSCKHYNAHIQMNDCRTGWLSGMVGCAWACHASPASVHCLTTTVGVSGWCTARPTRSGRPLHLLCIHGWVILVCVCVSLRQYTDNAGHQHPREEGGSEAVPCHPCRLTTPGPALEQVLSRYC